MGLWDILLLISVSAMGTLVAYLHSPRHKALVVSLPIPFTFATLALGGSVNATHVIGLIVLLGFWFAVYCMRQGLGLHIVVSIVLAALAYCAAGMFLAKLVPQTETSFWIAEAIVCLIAAFLCIRIPYRAEQGHSSSLPVWIKFPVLLAVVLGLIAMKSLLSGFMTVFPMVGVLTAYEARHSLWTVCRQIPVLMLAMAVMMAAIHLTSPWLGIGFSLVAGWIVLGAILIALLSRRWGAEQASKHLGHVLTSDNCSVDRTTTQ